MKESVFRTGGIVALALTVAPLLMAAEGNDIDGKAEFGEQKCLMCHGVAAEDLKPKARSEKMLGPDLSGFRSKMAFSKMAAFLRGEIQVDGAKHRKPFKGTDEELQAIIDWLGSLEIKQ
jgi:mono/diheme cytochrome c family protein